MHDLAFLIDTIETPSAGSERQLLTLLAGLDPERFRTRLFVLRETTWMRQSGLTYSVLGMHKWLSLDLSRGLTRLSEAHRERPFDLLQTHFHDANIVGALAARRLGLKTLVATRRNIGHWQSGLDRWVLRVMGRWTSHYLANSVAAADQAVRGEHAPPDRVSVIYNALEPTRFDQDLAPLRAAQRSAWGLDDETTVIGAVANLRPVKNLSSLVRAVAVLRKRFDVACVLVGEGPERQNLLETARSEGLNERLILAGQQEDVLPCLAAFDIAALTSSHESFSNAVIEYMAAGKPVVASRVGGNPEAIRPERSGLLYDVTRPDQLVESLERMLTNPAWSGELGAQAKRDAMSRFGRAQILSQHERFYETILTAPRDPAPFQYRSIARAAKS